MKAAGLTPPLCECGCGGRTRINRGKIRRFIHGHNRRQRSREERFWEKVASPQVPDGCWEWTACRNPSGYGRFGGSEDPGTREAHRIAYELAIGPIPDGHHIDHLCLNPACVNPYHLEAVTQAENNRRGGTTSGQRMTKCKRGHDWTDPANVAVRANGTRRCRPCARKSIRREVRA